MLTPKVIFAYESAIPSTKGEDHFLLRVSPEPTKNLHKEITHESFSSFKGARWWVGVGVGGGGGEREGGVKRRESDFRVLQRDSTEVGCRPAS